MTATRGKRIVQILTLLVISIAAQIFAQNKIEGLAEINGTKIHYETAGKGRAVVLIHGGLADSRMWDDQFDAFAKKFRVVRYDLRGYGKSDFPTGAFSHIEDLDALLKFLKIEKASLVGLSIGGVIAADFALAHPEIVKKLVFTSSGLRGDKSPRDEQSVAVYQAAEKDGMERAIALWLDHPFFATGKNNLDYEKRTGQMLADNYRYWGPTPQPIPVTWSDPETIERLAEIKAPTLVIVGGKDAPFIQTIADTLQTKIGGAEKVVIKDVSHHLNMEKPREYNRIVLKFLKRK